MTDCLCYYSSGKKYCIIFRCSALSSWRYSFIRGKISPSSLTLKIIHWLLNANSSSAQNNLESDLPKWSQLPYCIFLHSAYTYIDQTGLFLISFNFHDFLNKYFHGKLDIEQYSSSISFFKKAFKK